MTAEAWSGRRIFGTDGIRGVANIEPLTVETVVKLGRAAAVLFQREKNPQHRYRIVIGKDTRLSGYMIEAALMAGICSMGMDVIVVGPLPTPGIAFITRSLKADAGIVISASHNPYQDNGIKVFNRDGWKLPDEEEARLESLMSSAEVDALRPTADLVGKAFRVDDAVGRYIEHVKATFPKGLTLDGFSLVLDTANGAAYKAAPRILEELGAKVVTIHASPTGMNINDGCGALHTGTLVEYVRETGADAGIALDGDADRCILVDAAGNVVDGDRVMAFLALDLHERGQLRGETICTTVMSNKGLDISVGRWGGKVVRTQVGDRYVLEEMRARDLNFGGEQSGHMIFLDHSTSGDGSITALQALSLMARTGRTLAELSRVMEPLPQVLVNVEVARRAPLEELPDVQAAIRTAESALGSAGRVLVRYSGTQTLLRVMIEGEDRERIETLAGEIAEAARRGLGSPAS
ncbi:MAG: phosphoglucosamine mutase [Acidobacteriota bacterium]